MKQLFFAGKAYLKINSLVKTPLHEFMAVECSGLWAPVPTSLLGRHLAMVESLCVPVIQRTQPVEAEPLAGATKPERSMGRDQTKGSEKKNHSDNYFVCILRFGQV